ETSLAGIRHEGLGFDRCAVAVVTDLGENLVPGASTRGSLEDQAAIARVAVESVAATGTAVLNADDSSIVSLASHCTGAVLFYANWGDHPVVVAHRRRGERAAFIRDGVIVLARGDHEAQLTCADNLPDHCDPRGVSPLGTALVAAATVWALGI